jgi:ribonuclease P protein component
MKHTGKLRKNSQFRHVISSGKPSANGTLVLYSLKSGLAEGRLGIQVSKKVGGSVVRSRVTRLIRECYRLSEEKVIPGYDMVFIAKSAAKDATFANVMGALIHLLKKQGLLAREVMDG